MNTCAHDRINAMVVRLDSAYRKEGKTLQLTRFRHAAHQPFPRRFQVHPHMRHQNHCYYPVQEDHQPKHRPQVHFDRPVNVSLGCAPTSGGERSHVAPIRCGNLLHAATFSHQCCRIQPYRCRVVQRVLFCSSTLRSEEFYSYQL